MGLLDGPVNATNRVLAVTIRTFFLLFWVSVGSMVGLAIPAAFFSDGSSGNIMLAALPPFGCLLGGWIGYVVYRAFRDLLEGR
jgi:hypothetical protein